MREGWEVRKLVELCAFFSDGNWIESKDQSESGYRLIQTGNIGVGEFRHKSGKERYVSGSTFTRLRCTEIFEGDILISRLPDPVGRSCIIPASNEKMITAVDCSILRLKSDQLIPSFFQYYTQSNKYFKSVAEKITGTTRDRISRRNLGLIPIPVPPVSEQQYIVSALDEVFKAINEAKANIERNLQNAKELFQSELNSTFITKGNDWQEMRLDEIALTFGRGKSKHRPRNDERLYGGEYPFIQTGDVRNSERIIESYSQTYNEVGLKQSKLWPKGTICITIAANIAETGILDFDSCFPDSIIGLVVDENKADRDYTYYALLYLKTALQLLGKGSAQDNINMGTFENQKFPFPSLSEQQAIVYKLNKFSAGIKKLEGNYREKLKSLETLKKSILDKAFKGKLKMSDVVTKQSVQTIVNISATDLHAGIIALSIQQHEKANTLHTFHHVKSEKIVHMIESHLRIDLGRTPVKDAAGPNDYPLKMKVESRAKKAGFFYVEQSGDAKNYRKGGQFGGLIDKVSNSLGGRLDEVYSLIDLMAPMTTQQAEIIATVYAAWNNLLLDGANTTDEAIVREAREDWHAKKLNIERDRFFKAITWMREQNLTPSGTGKRVNKKP